MQKEIIIENSLLSSFIQNILERYPKKSFGYFLSDKPNGNPTDYILFEEDVRNDMREDFEEYGNYYKRNNDAGFLSNIEEMVKIHKEIQKSRKFIVGVYHSHQRHPAIFSKVDVDLHPSRNLWHLIISLRNINYPDIRVFYLEDSKVKEATMQRRCTDDKKND